MYKYVQGRNDLIINDFKAAGITEVAEKGNVVFHRIENPLFDIKSNSPFAKIYLN